MTELSSKAIALVRTGRAAIRPSPADRERMAAALRARLGDAALASEPAAAFTVLHPPWAKLSLAGAIGIAGVAALFFAFRAPSVPSLKPAAGVVVVRPVVTAAQLSVSRVSTTPAVALAEPKPNRTSMHRDPDALAQEVAILSRATSELHAKRVASALSILDEHQRKFPTGVLSEERHAARAQALCALGRRNEAELEIESLSRNSRQSANALHASKVCGISTRPR